MSTRNRRSLRRQHEAGFLLVVAMTAVASSGACNAVFGVDDLSYGGGTTSAGAGGSGGSVEVDPCSPPVSDGCKSFAEESCLRQSLCWPFWVNVTYGAVQECIELTKR